MVQPVASTSQASWKQDSRYANAKALFECGDLEKKAFDNIVLMCQADASPDKGFSGNVSNVKVSNVTDVSNVKVSVPNVAHKRKVSEYESDEEDPDWEQAADFSDLVSCIITFFPEAKDEQVKQLAHEFLFGAAACTNRRKFVKLKLFSELDNLKARVNDRVEKLSFGFNKTLNVWPQCTRCSQS